MVNIIYNEDCLVTMKKLPEKSVDLIITSPPYNSTPRRGGPSDKGKYDVYRDWKSEDEYIDWTVDVFNGYNKVLRDNRVVLYNFGYSIQNPSLPYKMISKIVERTNFDVVDTIVWKKNTSMPHPASYNRLNRVYEFIFVFSRKKEVKSFEMSKKVVSVSEKTGQKYYNIVDNLIYAKNNDGVNELNKATFSTELVSTLIGMYGKESDLIYDSFMGIGTTALASLQNDCRFIGSEISKKQCEFANKKIEELINNF
jgi:site-specific DNA-methyltransferase (adenine-specific)